MTDQYPWMCELCFDDCKEIGILAPGYSLILKPDGKYWILGGQGHSGEELVQFPTTPFPDPDPKCESDDPAVEKEADRWLDEADLFEEAVKKVGFTLSQGYAFYRSCIEAGYNGSPGVFEFWVFDRAGRMIQGIDVPHPEQKRDMHWNYRIMRHKTPLPEKFQEIAGHPYETWYAMHEVYWDENGKIGWTQEPVSPFGTNVEELKWCLRMMLADTDDGVLEYDEKGQSDGRGDG